MAYRVTFRRGKRVSSSKLLACDLEAAAAYARVQLPVQRRNMGVTSASITCERTGEIMYTLAEQPVDVDP